MIKTNITCPLCGSEYVHYDPHEKDTREVHLGASKIVHVYKCDDCPFIGFEYVHPSDYEALAKAIK